MFNTVEPVKHWLIRSMNGNFLVLEKKNLMREHIIKIERKRERERNNSLRIIVKQLLECVVHF